MAKYRETPMTAEDLTEYVTNQDDFGLELFVYSKARTLGLQATHGGTYIDPITEKPRQYDVRVSAAKLNRRIDLAIECKSLKPSYPLLISRIPRIAKESFHKILFSPRPQPSRIRTATSLASLTTQCLTLKRDVYFYPEGTMVGKSTVQVGRNIQDGFVTGDADVYDKWTQALGSSAALIHQAGGRHLENSDEALSSAILPVLVVANDTLWVADYSEDGTLINHPKQVNETTLFVGRHYKNPMGFGSPFIISHLHIYTKVGIEALLTKIASDESYWELLFPQREILKASAASD